MEAPRHRLSKIDMETMTAVCAVCGPTGIRTHKVRGYCICLGKERMDRERYRDKKRAYNRVYNQKIKAIKFNLSIDEVEALQRRRPAKCPICLKKVVRMDLDHCHRTGDFRGWLCRSCNVGLGHFRDDPEMLSRAVKYLTP